MEIFRTRHDPALIAMLQEGAVGILATDTVYGLVASARHPEAVARMYGLKHRERKPGPTIAASAQQLVELGIDPRLVSRVAHLWPNPISVILPLPDSLQHIHQGRGGSPFRVVAERALRDMLAQTGPLVTSSANLPGQPPATTVDEARAYFGQQVDFYVDGGDVGHRPPSTIIQLDTAGRVTVLREGAIIVDKQGNIIT